MSHVLCFDVAGEAHTIPADQLKFKPAVFGLFVEHDQILLQPNPITNLLHPPGQLLTNTQHPSQAIQYEFREVIGIMPDVGPLLFIEDQYRMDEAGTAWKLSVLYYMIERPKLELSFGTLEIAPTVQWHPLDTLTRDQMQFGYEAIEAAKLSLKL